MHATTRPCNVNVSALLYLFAQATNYNLPSLELPAVRARTGAHPCGVGVLYSLLGLLYTGKSNARQHYNAEAEPKTYCVVPLAITTLLHCIAL
jgi:hypothetical protein